MAKNCGVIFLGYWKACCNENVLWWVIIIHIIIKGLTLLQKKKFLLDSLY